MWEPPIAYAKMASDKIESMLKSGLIEQIDTSDWIALVHYVKRPYCKLLPGAEQSHSSFSTPSHPIFFVCLSMCQVCEISVETGPLQR